ncbi:cupin domain-containing protein [Dactylosporangium sp. NPDC050588]|uniref:cupin domain-containing protein n=1 Tax=Dactylosporangium sp. NPDC050588 TaxID=3157211 RepID=UPI0033DCAEBA
MWIDGDVDCPEPSRLRTLRAQFSPGARTAWHRRPYARILTILHGVGRVQRRGGPIHEVRAGDTVAVAAGEWHWHGAAPNASLAVVEIHETGPDDTGTEWGEHVTDAQYRLAPLTAMIRRPDADRVPQREACW